MRILYLSQYFPPEVGATQTRAYEMARYMVTQGHHVTMLTEVPNHPKGIIPPEYQDKWYEQAVLDGIDVRRVWVKTSPQKNFYTRMAFYLSFMGMATLAGLFKAEGRYDLIYATSPPLFVGGAALALSYLRQLPLVFEVRDLWPELAVAMGELKNPLAITLAEWLEKACYRRAKKIVVVTRGYYERMQARGYPVDKLAVITNGTNADLFQFKPAAGQELRQKLGLSDKFIAIYAGLHGLAQKLDTVLEAATQLTDHNDIHFLFVGEGPVKQEIVAQATQQGLPNVTFHPEVPRQQMPVFLSAANAALVPLYRSNLAAIALPSKMFDAWACQCPTLVSVDGEARQVLGEAGAGLFVEPENAQALAAAILKLKNDPVAAQEMGLKGRRFVTEHYSRQAQAQQLAQLLQSILAQKH